MSDSSTKPGKSGKAERVDAEFEPAPGDSAKTPSEPKPKPGLPWLKITGFSILAAAIGGASGYGLGRVWPAPTPTDLSAVEARLESLESQPQNVIDLDPIETRLDGLESASQLRGSALEEIVARLGVVEDEAEADGSSGLDAIDLDLSAFETRLLALEEGVQTARDEAGSARSALDQLQDALLSQSADPGADSTDNEASTALIAVLQSEVSALSEQVMTLSGQVEAMDLIDPIALELIDTRIGVLEQTVSELASDMVSGGAPNQGGVLIAGAAPTSERALAFAQLARTASGTAPFAVELADLRRVWPDAPGIADLIDIASEGALDAAGLSEAFPELALRELTGETQIYFGVLRIDRAGEPGPAAQIVEALAREDLSAARALIQSVSRDGQQLLSEWRDLLEARLAVDDGLEVLSNALENPQEASE